MRRDVSRVATLAAPQPARAAYPSLSASSGAVAAARLAGR